MTIQPKLIEMAEEAFVHAFGDKVNLKDRRIYTLILAHAAMLEMGAEYIRLRAFEKTFQHLISEKLINASDAGILPATEEKGKLNVLDKG